MTGVLMRQNTEERPRRAHRKKTSIHKPQRRTQKRPTLLILSSSDLSFAEVENHSSCLGASACGPGRPRKPMHIMVGYWDLPNYFIAPTPTLAMVNYAETGFLVYYCSVGSEVLFVHVCVRWLHLESRSKITELNESMH